MSHVLNTDSHSATTDFLSFTQPASRTRRSYPTWIPWTSCTSLRGWRRPSWTAARWLLRNGPSSAYRGRPATCVVWLPSASALAPPTPSPWPTPPTRSGGTMNGVCRRRRPLRRLRLTVMTATCSTTLSHLCLPLASRDSLLHLKLCIVCSQNHRQGNVLYSAALIYCILEFWGAVTQAWSLFCFNFSWNRKES